MSSSRAPSKAGTCSLTRAARASTPSVASMNVAATSQRNALAVVAVTMASTRRSRRPRRTRCRVNGPGGALAGSWANRDQRTGTGDQDRTGSILSAWPSYGSAVTVHRLRHADRFVGPQQLRFCIYSGQGDRCRILSLQSPAECPNTQAEPAAAACRTTRSARDAVVVRGSRPVRHTSRNGFDLWLYHHASAVRAS